MKKLFLVVLMMCFLCSMGCATQKTLNKGDSQEISSERLSACYNTISVPNPAAFSENTPILYDTYYVDNSEVEAFTFESHYPNGSQNPEYTLLFSISNGEKKELTRLTKQEAIIAFADTNSQGIYWTTPDNKVYSYLFSENKTKVLPITCMTTFSLSDDYLLFIDSGTEKLSYFDLKEYSIEVISEVSLMNEFWMPSLSDKNMVITAKQQSQIKINIFNLKNKNNDFSYEIEDKRIRNIIKAFYSEDWLIFMCVEDERDYSGFSLYHLNIKDNSAKALDKKVDFCEVLSPNILIYICEGMVFKYNMITGESIAIEGLETKSFYRVSKTPSGIISLKTIDNLEVVVLNNTI